jgi:hypothetical protein
MSAAGEANGRSRGPKGAAPRESRETDTCGFEWRRRCKELEAMSAAGEANGRRARRAAQ